MRYPRTRIARKGSILATAMLFFVLVTVAGTAILSMSTIQRIKTVRNGIDVRLMIAAEAGIESVRGRFTLVEGVQDDWNWLNNATWTNVDTVTVNGINVTIDAMLWGGPSVPTARLRSYATASGKTRFVEYLIKVASFSDYAVFTSSGGTLGQDYKLVGNYFADGNLSIPNTGAQMFGRVQLTGTINQTNGEPQSYTFPVQNPEPLSGNIPFPNNAYQWNLLVDKADTTGLVYGENTLEIIFNGTNMTRWFVRRRATGAGNGTVPGSAGAIDDSTNSWISPHDGTIDYSNSSATNQRLVNADYEFVSETVPIPNEGVIYIRSGPARLAQASDPNKDALGGGTTNNFTQATGSSSVNSTTSPYGASTFINNRVIFTSSVSGTYEPILVMSGRLASTRVSIACDHKIVVKQPIIYDSLLNDPTLRRFYDDASHVTGKQSQAALNIPEMLGVMSRDDITPAVTWWRDVDSNFGGGGVTTGAGEIITTAHYPTDTYCMDGVYLALGETSPRRHYNFSPGNGPRGEMWFHGGLIGQTGYGGGNGNTFYRRNYDWDYRMALTMPPYFLNAYNTSATFVPGTWRTWES
ncbi:MAG: hypothetical protein K8I27_04975 [Planctomycetes bacterium]|nr:hypothetical protein [Planctomycetota bacterium]